MVRWRFGGINAAVVRGKTALARRRMHHTADGDGGVQRLSDAKPWIQLPQRVGGVERAAVRQNAARFVHCASSAWLFVPCWLLASVILPLANSGILLVSEPNCGLRVASRVAGITRNSLFVVVLQQHTKKSALRPSSARTQALKAVLGPVASVVHHVCSGFLICRLLLGAVTKNCSRQCLVVSAAPRTKVRLGLHAVEETHLQSNASKKQ